MPEVLERGELHVLYRPAVDTPDPGGLVDVADLHLVLVPDGAGPRRLLTIGKKRLPEHQGEDRHWGYVALATDDAASLAERLGPRTYDTGTRGRRTSPPARPAGHGRYALVTRGRDTLLVHVLDLPGELGEVQRDLRLDAEGAFVLAVKNPDAGSPPEAGRDADPDLPAELRARFEERRWLAADPPALLDHEDVEFVMIAADGAEAGAADVADADAGRGADVDEVLRQLHLDRDTHPVAPLVDGAWA